MKLLIIIREQIFTFYHWISSITLNIDDVLCFKRIDTWPFYAYLTNMYFLSYILLSKTRIKLSKFNLLKNIINNIFSLIDGSCIKKLLIPFLKSISSLLHPMTSCIDYYRWTKLRYLALVSINIFNLFMYKNPCCRKYKF